MDQSVHPTRYVPAPVLTWLATAHRGESLEYYRGDLVRDISPPSSRLNENDIMALLSVKRTAWDRYTRQLATLVQRRHGDHDYSYLIQALGPKKEEPTPKPRRAKVLRAW